MTRDRLPRRRLLGTFVLYLAAVARITLWPSFADDGTLGRVRDLTEWLSSLGLPVTFDGVEAFANVVMFVPFGVLAGLLAGRRHWWRVVAAGCATSVLIELSQLAFLPSRFPTVQDVVMNTLGAAAGIVALVVAHHVHRTRTVRADLEQVS